MRESLEQIAKAAATMLGVPLVLISVFLGRRPIYVCSQGSGSAPAGEPSPLCLQVASAGRPILIQDAQRRIPPASRGAWGSALGGYAGVPLPLLGSPLTGTIAALSPIRRAWQEQDLHLLRSLAAAAAAITSMHVRCEEILDVARREAGLEIAAASAKGKRRTLDLERTSFHDELTGLLNRRGLFAVARAQLAVIRQHAIGGFLLYVDLDGLKATNDRDGHAAGDSLLRSAARVLQVSFRNVDTVARLGGDEFVVIATDAPRNEHPAILARLATELGRVNKGRDTSNPLAWSIGLVSIDPAATISLDRLMSAADRRMYAAKRTLRPASSTVPAVRHWRESSRLRIKPLQELAHTTGGERDGVGRPVVEVQ